MHALLSRFVPLVHQPVPLRMPRRRVTPAEALPLACGWFDSSHELQQGLCVCELPAVQPAAGAAWPDAGGNALM